MITKQQMLEAIRTLPDDATVDDAIERLHIIDLIERRIAAADAGDTVTHEEARRRLAQWLQ
jgi:predicted transcriptional regulator